MNGATRQRGLVITSSIRSFSVRPLMVIEMLSHALVFRQSGQ